MIRDIITYLASSPVGGRPIAYQRDDDRAPFSDTTTTPVLIRQQPGSADRDITRTTFDIWVFTAGNPTNSEIGTLMDTAKALEEYIVANFKQDPIHNIDVIGGVSGPYRDGQQRQSASLTIRVSGATNKPA